MHLGHPGLFQLVERDVFAGARGEVVGRLLNVGEGIDFVEYQNHGLVGRVAHLLQGLVHHLDLLLESRVRNVHDVEQQVGLAHLVESRLERVDQVGGQFTDEPYGIGEEEGQVVDNHLAHRGVEGGKELVLGKDLALGQQVHQGRLAHVGIAHQRHAHQFAAVFALDALLAVDAFQLLFQVRNLVEDDTAVGLDLGLTGTTHTDTAPLPLEVRPQAGKPRQQILVLRQLDLPFGVGRLGPFGKDVENEAGAVENLHLQFLLNVLHLLGREVVVEDDHAYLVLVDVVLDFGQLARTDECAGVGGVEPLQKLLHRLGTGSFGQEGQFVEVFVSFRLVLGVGNQPHQNGAFGFFLG